MQNNVTELVFILDRSGSMAGFEADTIGGFNATIEKQEKQDGKVYVSTVLFDNESDVVHDRVDINEIKPMTEKEYQVGGCTALLDAIGGAIHHIGNIHKYARPEDIPEHTVFVITTDGTPPYGQPQMVCYCDARFPAQVRVLQRRGDRRC